MLRQELLQTTPDTKLLTGRHSSEKVPQNRSEPAFAVAVILDSSYADNWTTCSLSGSWTSLHSNDKRAK